MWLCGWLCRWLRLPLVGWLCLPLVGWLCLSLVGCLCLPLVGWLCLPLVGWLCLPLVGWFVWLDYLSPVIKATIMALTLLENSTEVTKKYFIQTNEVLGRNSLLMDHIFNLNYI